MLPIPPSGCIVSYQHSVITDSADFKRLPRIQIKADPGFETRLKILFLIIFAHLNEALDVEIWLEGLNMLDKKLGPDLGEEVGGRQARHYSIRLAASPISWLLLS